MGFCRIVPIHCKGTFLSHINILLYGLSSLYVKITWSEAKNLHTGAIIIAWLWTMDNSNRLCDLCTTVDHHAKLIHDFSLLIVHQKYHLPRNVLVKFMWNPHPHIRLAVV